MGKTYRGAAKAKIAGKRKRRRDKHAAPPPPPLDETRLVGKPKQRSVRPGR